MKLFNVATSLNYTHGMSVGVMAEDHMDAIAKTATAFKMGTLWDNTPKMPLLFDSYDAEKSSQPEFVACEVSEFTVDPSVQRSKSVRVGPRAEVALRSLVALLTSENGSSLIDSVSADYDAKLMQALSQARAVVKDLDSWNPLRLQVVAAVDGER